MTPEEVTSALCSAIDGMLEVEIKYAREGDKGRRRCRPHILFEDAAGKRLLELFQVSGYSSRPLPEWRCLDVEEIRDVQVTNSPFTPADGYNPLNRHRYQRPICWVGRLRLVPKQLDS